MINFGNVTEAAPGEDLAMNDEAADAPQQTQAPSEAQPDEQEQMTQQTDEDVPVVKEEKKPEKFSLTFDGDRIRKYFPKSYTPLQMENTIIKLLEAWQKKRQRSQER